MRAFTLFNLCPRPYLSLMSLPKTILKKLTNAKCQLGILTDSAIFSSDLAFLGLDD